MKIKITDSRDVWEGKLYLIKGDDGKEYKVWKKDFGSVDVGSEIEGNVEEVKNKKGYTDTFIKAYKKPSAAGGSSGYGSKSYGGSGNVAAFALSYSKDFYVAKIEKGDEVLPGDIIATAEEFYKWLKSK